MVLSACSQTPSERFDCRTVEASVSSMKVMLGELGTILDTAEAPADALNKVQKYIQGYKSAIDLCSANISGNLQTMTEDEVVAFLESSIKDERVRLFLDAQDRFQKQASAAQQEALEDIASPVYIFF